MSKQSLLEFVYSLLTFPRSTITGSLRGSTTAVTSLDNVLCAVNTMGQKRFRVASGMQNAWCKVGETRGYREFTWPNVAVRPDYRA